MHRLARYIEIIKYTAQFEKIQTNLPVKMQSSCPPPTALVELGTKSAFTMISEYRTICQIIMKTSFVIPFILSSFFKLRRVCLQPGTQYL